ncbi:DUF4184 family protein [Flavobacterium geliluteum]|uniref:DUF4184 family protein n=1 Tax=Flavobacterium geliluteum TaxID=2816120 RepID=A0A940X9R8_9FLAO|nr:DUF4184 family protein [Flavobacterium geliluteum]MBP4139380.1 DUF4184 family protein [Flavobacterium geliluteum]
MPFTFSHPAIVLPLHFLPKKWFSLTSLIIGTLTPDFEYFLRMKVQSTYSHTVYGIFWFDLPLGLLLAFVFHNIVRDSLFYNLPKVIKSRVLFFTEFNWNDYFKENWIVIIISFLIGIASHLFWDSFTHETGYFVNEIKVLQNTIYIADFEIPYYKIAQHLSSLVGMFVIILSLLKMPKNKIYKSYPNKKYWFIVAVLVLFILMIRLSVNFNINAIGNAIVSIISALMIALILTPFLIKLKVNS